MAAPTTSNEFLELIRKSGVADVKKLDPHIAKLRAEAKLPAEPNKLAGILIRDGLVTQFQAQQLLQGKWRRFTIGKYKVLERLGSGGMGSVYLCEHKLMRRRVAVKVLPSAKAAEQSSLERFYREARAVAALDHPNIVHAYDIDQDDSLHFLVMEFVDGASLQEIVKRSGPLDPIRAAHYIYQTTQGLAHAHLAGLVHRDIKPGNLLVDRQGTVKILDMGLARFFNDEEDILTRKYDENVLGTADYLAPEQAVDSHEADTRADIYSLGATFYFLLTGRTPFDEGTVAQKLIWHQTRRPKAIDTYRTDVPKEMTAIIDKMMAKNPDDRYQHPLEVGEALKGWVSQPIAPPPESEMPQFSKAAARPNLGDASQAFSQAGGATSSRNWKVTGATTTGWATPAPVVQAPPPTAAPPQTSPPPATSPGAPTPHPHPPAATPSPRPTTPMPAQPQPVDLPSPQPSEPIKPAPKAPRLPTLPALQQADREPASSGGPAKTEAAAPVSAESNLDPEVEELAKESFSDRLRRKPKSRLSWLWWLGLFAATVGISSGAGLAWFFLIEPAMQASRTNTRPALKVGNVSGANAFRTIAQALGEARNGDVIELWDEKHRENLIVSPRLGHTGVTIRPAPGKTVRWSAEAGKESDPLVHLTSAAGFRIEGDGLILDGGGASPRLVLVSLESPGVTFADAQLQGYTDKAIHILNCRGEPDRPVRFLRLDFSAAAGKKAKAFYFDANPNQFPPVNDYIEVRDCRFREMSAGEAIGRNGTRKNAVLGKNVMLP